MKIAGGRRRVERTAKGGGSPDCPFEHVTVVYGIRIPSRDATLRSLAPRVRALLEQQYPQLATATLADGSHVKYEGWQQQAAADRKEAVRLRREMERLSQSLTENQSALDQARTVETALRAQMSDFEQATRDAAQQEQQPRLADATVGGCLLITHCDTVH